MKEQHSERHRHLLAQLAGAEREEGNAKATNEQIFLRECTPQRAADVRGAREKPWNPAVCGRRLKSSPNTANWRRPVSSERATVAPHP